MQLWYERWKMRNNLTHSAAPAHFVFSHGWAIAILPLPISPPPRFLHLSPTSPFTLFSRFTHPPNRPPASEGIKATLQRLVTAISSSQWIPTCPLWILSSSAQVTSSASSSPLWNLSPSHGLNTGVKTHSRDTVCSDQPPRAEVFMKPWNPTVNTVRSLWKFPTE